MSITSMFNNSKKNQKRQGSQRKQSKFEKLNVGKTDEEAFEEAIRMSLKINDEKMSGEISQ